MFGTKTKKSLNNKRNLITKSNPKSPISEQFRTIRTNIQFTSVDRDIQVMMVTSSTPGEGKSTNAANLAVVFAQQGKNVLLIDADLRKPTMHYTFNFSNTFGLTNILTRRMGMDEVIRSTEVEHLSLLTSGPIPPNPAELLASKSMQDLLGQLRQKFDIIIIDTPPLLAVADAQILSNICDGSILVINSGTTETENALTAKEKLASSKSPIIGAILNRRKSNSKQEHYYYYGE